MTPAPTEYQPTVRTHSLGVVMGRLGKGVRDAKVSHINLNCQLEMSSKRLTPTVGKYPGTPTISRYPVSELKARIRNFNISELRHTYPTRPQRKPAQEQERRP